MHIERKIGAGQWTYFGYFNALSGAQKWNWTNTGLSVGQTYCYRLRAQNGYGYSVYSNEACGTTQTMSAALSAPSDLLVSNYTASSLRLNFKDNATTETSILIERKKTPVGAWESFGSFPSLSGTGNWYWDNTGLTQKTTYCYRLTAIDSIGSRSQSTEACGTTL